MSRRKSLFNRALLLCLVGLLAASAASSAYADDGISERLLQAEAAYQAGQHDEAIRLTREHLRTESLPVVERVEAYRILGYAYLAKGDEKQARRAVQELILVYPDYKPASSAPAEFAGLVEEARSRYASGTLYQGSGQKMQLFYTTAAVAMTALVIGLSSQDW